jgi:hypothetical protein
MDEGEWRQTSPSIVSEGCHSDQRVALVDIDNDSEILVLSSIARNQLRFECPSGGIEATKYISRARVAVPDTVSEGPHSKGIGANSDRDSEVIIAAPIRGGHSRSLAPDPPRIRFINIDSPCANRKTEVTNRPQISIPASMNPLVS